MEKSKFKKNLMIITILLNSLLVGIGVYLFCKYYSLYEYKNKLL